MSVQFKGSVHWDRPLSVYISLTMSKHRLRKQDRATETPPPAEAQDTSPRIHQRDKIKWHLTIRERDDLTERQKTILEVATHKDTRGILIDGYWGTSKSYLAVLASLRLLNQHRVSDIIYVRAGDSSNGNKIGYLPGDASAKMAPYNAVFYDKLEELLPRIDIDRLKKEDRVICVPLGFIRGLSWSCKAIIVDEAAGMTFEDLVLLLSRCGEFTRIFFIGDSKNQNDIGNRSGFERLYRYFDDQESKDNGVHAFKLRNKEDLVRSGFIRWALGKVGVIEKI